MHEHAARELLATIVRRAEAILSRDPPGAPWEATPRSGRQQKLTRPNTSRLTCIEKRGKLVEGWIRKPRGGQRCQTTHAHSSTALH
eukprot:8067176-Pyramimonas_sp.AAC.1